MTKKNKRIFVQDSSKYNFNTYSKSFDLNMSLKIGGYLFTYLLIAYDILLKPL